jgi:hypothetical protein
MTAFKIVPYATLKGNDFVKSLYIYIWPDCCFIFRFIGTTYMLCPWTILTECVNEVGPYLVAFD